PGAVVVVRGRESQPLTTGPTGRFLVPGLPLGPWELRATGPDHGDPGRRWMARSRGSLVENQDDEVEVSLVAHPVRGVLGIRYERVEAGIRVTAVKPGGGAETCGLEPGDELLEVDGVSLAGSARSDVDQLLVGPAGTVLILVTVRGDHQRELRCSRVTSGQKATTSDMKGALSPDSRGP
ncbi:MAG: PDZ domain-containing protein, partial [Myxococcota bacterium]|nr:PDZ domain-containing protein [Myxococcota bacterium]